MPSIPEPCINTATSTVIRIEVAFASATQQEIVELEVPFHTTAEEAIALSGIQDLFPEHDLGKASIGIFGKIVPRDHLLADRDRVEIYRKLKQAPTEARRKRAAKAKIGSV